MKGSFGVTLLLALLPACFSFGQSIMNENNGNSSLIQISQKLLLAAKRHENTDSLTLLLSNLPESALDQQLTDDNHKKAFWINLYNAYTQVMLSGDPALYQQRNVFFGSRRIAVAGRHLSLDDIEHGILRRSKIKWSLGYLNKLFPSAFDRKQRVATLDPRIHFSLNCGAKSCPPIAFYTPEQLDRQLELATKTYLKGESRIDTASNIFYLPTLMSWFRRDFGGKKGMKNILAHVGMLLPGQDATIKFKKYDWNLFLENYKPSNDG